MGKVNARLWRLEKENEKVREEIRGLVAIVRGWKGDQERGDKDTNDIMEELKEMKGRELEREKEIREDV